MPPNGLVIYCGTIVTEEGKEKKVNIDFEPFKPINTSLYLCDNKVYFVVLSYLHMCSAVFMYDFCINYVAFCSFIQKHSRRYLLMITNLVLLLWMVMEHCLVHYKVIHVKYYINLLWTSPRNMVCVIYSNIEKENIKIIYFHHHFFKNQYKIDWIYIRCCRNYQF